MLGTKTLIGLIPIFGCTFSRSEATFSDRLSSPSEQLLLIVYRLLIACFFFYQVVCFTAGLWIAHRHLGRVAPTNFLRSQVSWCEIFSSSPVCEPTKVRHHPWKGDVARCGVCVPGTLPTVSPRRPGEVKKTFNLQCNGGASPIRSDQENPKKQVPGIPCLSTQP